MICPKCNFNIPPHKTKPWETVWGLLVAFAVGLILGLNIQNTKYRKLCELVGMKNIVMMEFIRGTHGQETLLKIDKDSTEISFARLGRKYE